MDLSISTLDYRNKYNKRFQELWDRGYRGLELELILVGIKDENKQ